MGIKSLGNKKGISYASVWEKTGLGAKDPPPLTWTEGTAADWDYNASFNPATPNGGVTKASISPANQANAESGGWSMAVSAAALDTDRPTGLRFRMQNTTDNTHIGLSKTFADSASFNATIRDSTISYCLSWGWGGDYNNSNGTDVTNANLPGGFGQNDWTKIIIDPVNDKDIKIYNNSGTLKLTVNLTPSFIAEITAGNIYAMSDQYINGDVDLQRIPFTNPYRT